MDPNLAAETLEGLMLVPRYWARTEGDAASPAGKRYRFEIWGWSNESLADALATARRRLTRAASRIASGETPDAYFYAEQPLREEILRAFGAPGSRAEAVVTRNRYGALVLNTAQVPFIDVDMPEPAPLTRLFRALRRRGSETPPALDRIREACGRYARHSFRIYRTRAGFRVLATDLLLEPTSPQARDLLSAFGADPYFVKLCGIQASFRARLTPKPWRCGCALPPGRHPRQEADLGRRFAVWLAGYEKASARFASCRYLESAGPGRALPEVEAIVAEHDRVSCAQVDLPLA